MRNEYGDESWQAITEAAAQRFSNEPRPFLKWAGSKQALLRHVINVVPREFNRYYEPFLGGAALFFLLEPHDAILSDVCKPLVGTFKAVCENPEAILRHLKGRRPSKAEFYEVRDNPSTGRYKQAADFIYLNKTCWNGLYRVNAAGKFNVPYGLPRTDNIISASNLRACSRALQYAKLLAQDFEEVTSNARRGDFVYFDPPYVTGHNNNGFRDWNETLFSWSDQKRLAKHAKMLADRGVHVTISNADHAEIIKLYRGFKMLRFSRSSTLASSSTKRRAVGEVIFHTR